MGKAVVTTFILIVLMLGYLVPHVVASFDSWAPSVYAWHEPWWPTPNDTVKVYACVAGAINGVRDIALRYRVNGGPLLSSSMEEVYSVEGQEQFCALYVAELPPQPNGTKVEYYVEAFDESMSALSCESRVYVVDPSKFDSWAPSVYAWHEPWWPTPNDTVKVYACVVEFENDVEEAVLYYSLDNRTWEVVEMEESSKAWPVRSSFGEYYAQKMFEGSIPRFPENTTVYYYVEAVDSVGNRGRSLLGNYTVTSSPPTFAYIYTWQDPSNVDEGDTVTVWAYIVTANVELQEVMLYYEVNGSSNWDYMTFQAEGSEGVGATYYTAFGYIPGQPNGTYVAYCVKITAANGETFKSDLKNYTVGMPSDLNPPSVESVLQEPSEVEEGEDVRIEARISDDVSVERAEIWYATNLEGLAVVNMTYDRELGRWIGTIPSHPAGTIVVYVIVAYDQAENVGFSDLYYFFVGRAGETRYQLIVQVLEEDWDPVSGALVTAIGENREAVLSNCTDAYGTAELNLLPGLYRLEIVHGMFYQELLVDVVEDDFVRVFLGVDVALRASAGGDGRFDVLALVQGFGDNIEGAVLHYYDGAWKTQEMTRLASRAYASSITLESVEDIDDTGNVIMYVELKGADGSVVKAEKTTLASAIGIEMARPVLAPLTPLLGLVLATASLAPLASRKRRS